MTTVTIENPHSAKDLPPYQNIDEDIRKRNKSRVRRKIFFGSLLFVWVLAFLLYFTLPRFHFSAVKVNGLSNLTEEDYIALTGTSGGTSLLFVDAQKNDTASLAHSAGLLLSSKSSVNAFHAEASVVENYPVASLASKTYFGDGKTFEEISASFASLPFSDTRKQELLSHLSDENSRTSLPVIHLPKDTKSDESTPKAAVKAFVGLPYSVLTTIEGVQYLNPNGDTTWNNVLEAVISDSESGKHFLFRNLLSDEIAQVFSEKAYLGWVLPALRKASDDTQDPLVKEDYTYQDGTVVKDTYVVTVHYDANEKTVIITRD